MFITLTNTTQFFALEAEMILVAIVMIFQTIAAFYPRSSRLIGIMTIYCTIAALLYFLLRIYYFFSYGAPGVLIGFNGSFIGGSVLLIEKALILGFVIMTLVLYHNLTKIAGEEYKPEFYTLTLLSTVGIFIAISARDFILLFCGLELQSLSGYALAAFNPRDSKSSEAGLKYFILGALITCLMLFGISFLYGFSGSLSFADINFALSNRPINSGLVIGAILVLAAILFKLSAAPLHIWTPDVYEGAPLAVVSYFAVAQKLGMLAVLSNILNLAIGNFSQISVDIIRIAAVLSMIIGAFGAIMQASLKRLMAYSTVLNIGYVLIGMCLNTPEGTYAAYVYMIIYIMGVAGFFACIAALLGDKADQATFNDLKSIATSRKAIAASISILMFSMIGLPPLAGFFGKYYIFLNAIKQGELTLAVLGVLTSVIAAFYYLKAIKYMYFSDMNNQIKIIPTNRGLLFISTISIAFTMFFFLFASSSIFWI